MQGHYNLLYWDQVARKKYDGTEYTDRAIVERVAEIARKYGVTRSQIAVA